MKKEQAKSELMQIYMSLSEEKKKAIDVAVKALEQEPCEKVAQERYADLCEYFGGAKGYSKEQKRLHQSREWGEDYDVQQILGDIEDMPPVKPQEKTGHWEEVGEEYVQVYDLNGIPSCGDERICSECGFETVFIGEHCSQYKFCPNCGAKMD